LLLLLSLLLLSTELIAGPPNGTLVYLKTKNK